MADRKFILPGGEYISMSVGDARRLVGCGSGDAALLYIHMLESKESFSFDASAAALGFSAARMNAALMILENIGLVASQAPRPADTPPEREARPRSADATPEYTSEDIKREMEHGAEFKMLVDEVQSALGRILSSDDLIKLFGIYDSLGLPPAVILLLVNFCKGEYSAKFGKARIPTMRYIEKAAYSWERDEILTLDAAEQHIKRLGERRAASSEFKATLGIRDRNLTPSEQNYVYSWIDMGFGTDAVEIAYDRTVLKTGKLAWSYMDSILKNWHEKKLHTAEEIEKGDSRAPKSAGPVAAAAPAPTAEDIARMKKMLNKINGEA